VGLDHRAVCVNAAIAIAAFTAFGGLAACTHEPTRAAPLQNSTPHDSTQPARPGSTDAGSPTDSPTPEYHRYTNQRFNFSFDVPNDYVAGPEPQDRDGLTFTNTQQTATVGGFGQDNTLKWSPSQELQNLVSSYQSSGGTVTYQYVKGDLIVASGTTGHGTIFYVQQIVYPSVFYDLTLTYPTSEKAQYDSLVSHTVATFTPGPTRSN
jgi:hypothetical protein